MLLRLLLNTLKGSTSTSCSSTPPINNNKHQIAAAISVDSGISRLSQSASLSAVATAGGLTVNTPLPSINGNHHHQEDGDGDEGGGGDGQENNGRSNQIPLPLLSRFNLPTPSNHYLHHQHSSNNSIETQLGSMPPLHPDANPESNGSANGKPAPLHQRRRQSAPTTLTIPFS